VGFPSRQRWIEVTGAVRSLFSGKSQAGSTGIWNAAPIIVRQILDYVPTDRSSDFAKMRFRQYWLRERAIQLITRPRVSSSATWGYRPFAEAVRPILPAGDGRYSPPGIAQRGHRVSFSTWDGREPPRRSDYRAVAAQVIAAPAMRVRRD
jgi:hypothetical protein